MNSFRLTQNQADFAKLQEDIASTGFYSPLENYPIYEGVKQSEQALLPETIKKLKATKNDPKERAYLKDKLTLVSRKYSNSPFNVNKRDGNTYAAEQQATSGSMFTKPPVKPKPKPKPKFSFGSPIGRAAIGTGLLGAAAGGAYLYNKNRQEQEASYCYMGNTASFSTAAEDDAFLGSLTPMERKKELMRRKREARADAKESRDARAEGRSAYRIGLDSLREIRNWGTTLELL